MAEPSILVSDPKAVYFGYKREIDQAVQRVLESGRYILGEEVTAFEQEFARYLGVHCALGVASGTDALQLALRACGIGAGDSVITVSHTAVATVASIELTGATPAMVDIDPISFTMDPDRLEDAIEAHAIRSRSGAKVRPKAIIPVHIYGHPADMSAIMHIAKQHGLYVVEDCAQSHGSAIQGKMTGTWGDIAAFSFYPTKNLGALGDGGAVVTADPDLAGKLRMLREYGWRERYVSHLPGMNSRLDELQAAVLRVRLRHLETENIRRREIARIYQARLSATSLILPQVRKGVEHVYHQYVVRAKQRDELQLFLRANSIMALIHYPVPVHLQPAYQDLTAGADMRYTEQICREILSLPMHPHISDDQVEHITKLICEWLQ